MATDSPFSTKELELIGDALSSHRTWLKKTLVGRAFAIDLEIRLSELGALQEKVIVMKRQQEGR